MRIRSVLLCVLLFTFAAGASSQTSGSQLKPTAADSVPVVGVWRGQMNGLPAITLTVTNESGSLSGAILFYLLRRTPGQPETATPGIPEPLLNPKFDGETLTFQVSHRRAHPPATLSDPPVTFRMKLTGANAAALSNANEPAQENPGQPSGGLPMVRSEY
jgi:hypothetical protein